MAWLKTIHDFSKKHKRMAGFVAKQVVSLAFPGGVVIGDLIERLLAVTGLTEADALEIANKDELERIEAMLKVCLGPLHDLCKDVALKGVPDDVKHLINVQRATSKAVREGFDHLARIFPRFVGLEERNRQILAEVGYTKDRVETLIKLIQRNFFKSEFEHDKNSTGHTPEEHAQNLDALNYFELEMRSGNVVDVGPRLKAMAKEQPTSVSLQILAATASVLSNDVKSAEETLRHVAELHPEEPSLGVLSRSVYLATVPARKPLFDRYLFAEYSGGNENHFAEPGIRLWQAERDSAPFQVLRENGQNFSRDALRETVLDVLDGATQQNHRVIFGFDHQFGWPNHLRQRAGLNGLSWRDAIIALDHGGYGVNRNGPALAIPGRPSREGRPGFFCARFNNFVANDSSEWVFWSQLIDLAAKWGIPDEPPHILRVPGAGPRFYDTDDANPELRFRLTEQRMRNQEADLLTARYLPFHSNPKPADAVGGQGYGSVGGQTICGLHQIALMLEREDIAWWPFDGLDITSDAYKGKHVGVEIYPGIYPADGWPTEEYVAGIIDGGGVWPPETNAQRMSRDKDGDAWRSCRFVQHADRLLIPDRFPGVPDLQELMNLEGRLRQEYDRDQIQLEGWIIGV